MPAGFEVSEPERLWDLKKKALGAMPFPSLYMTQSTGRLASQGEKKKQDRTQQHSAWPSLLPASVVPDGCGQWLLGWGTGKSVLAYETLFLREAHSHVSNACTQLHGTVPVHRK